jgi:L-rhamnose mutarotase
MIKRMCHWGRIKADKIEEYKASHRDVWPDVLAEYRKAGITKISCFLHGQDLLVYTEYDDTRYPQSREQLSRSEVCKRWDKWMLDFAEPGFKGVEFQEVFRMD